MSPLHYFLAGFSMLFKPGFRLLTIGPILLNLLIYIALASWVFNHMSSLVEWMMGYVPDWLDFISYLIWLVLSVIALLGFGYTFAMVGAIIGAPFFGVLAEKVAASTGKRQYGDPLNFKSLLQLIKGSLHREWLKLQYQLPRLLLVFLITLTLGFTPVIGLFVFFSTFLWAAWLMSIQFVDYAADNDKVPFKQMLAQMRLSRWRCIFYGSIISFCLSIPVFNLIVLPAAVAGGTLFWVDHLSKQAISSQPVADK